MDFEAQGESTFSCESAEGVQGLAFLDTMLSRPLKSMPAPTICGTKRAFLLAG